jgi:hypothetical protein
VRQFSAALQLPCRAALAARCNNPLSPFFVLQGLKFICHLSLSWAAGKMGLLCPQAVHASPKAPVLILLAACVTPVQGAIFHVLVRESTALSRVWALVRPSGDGLRPHDIRCLSGSPIGNHSAGVSKFWAVDPLGSAVLGARYP